MAATSPSTSLPTCCSMMRHDKVVVSDPMPIPTFRLRTGRKSMATSPVDFAAILGLEEPSVEDDEAVSPLENGMSPSLLNDFLKAHVEKHKRTSTDDETSKNHKDNSKYRRSSSLKSGKTPPRTPRGEKIVKFADVLGLDLADVKTFLDEVPKVPRSAFRDLKDAELSDMESSDSGSERQFPVKRPSEPPISAIGIRSSPDPVYSALFNQPGRCSDFFDRVRAQKVALESCYMSDTEKIHGIVRVVNLDFHKRVFVRYSTNAWKTIDADIDATYVKDSSDGFSDKFEFTIHLTPDKVRIGQRLVFCIGYICCNNTYWDNNHERNYALLCVAGQKNGCRPVRVCHQVASVPVISKPTTFGVPDFISQSPSGMGDDPWQRFL